MNPTDIKYYAPLPHDMPDDYDPSDAIAEHADKMVCMALGLVVGILITLWPAIYVIKHYSTAASAQIEQANGATLSEAESPQGITK